MLQETVLNSLLNVLPRGRVFLDKSSLIAYEADGGVDKGLPDAIAFPHDTEELMRLVHWAAKERIPLVARGAGTGLSGGAVADRGGVIVAFSHMDRILDVDLHGRSAVVEPAMINLRLNERVKPAGLYFPPDPASQRASTIGGNVAENSGGPHCFKYGVTTNYVTGLEVVLADGQCVRVGGRALDYPEYDFCGLITGSEGMLALISSVSLRLVRNPPAVKTLLGIFDSVEQAGQAVSSVIATGLVPATMEMMDRQIIAIVEPFAHAGLPLDAGVILIIDVDGFPESLDAQIEEITYILEQHGGHDMRVSTNEEERDRIWLARKSVGGAIARLAPSYLTIDITVPRSRLSEILSKTDSILARYHLRSGHLLHAGDGNLHPMILIPDPEDPDLLERVHRAGREMVQCSVEMDGSLTGEHGVGIEKRDYMSLMHKPEELLAMWDIKLAFDPQNILNPGKVFPRPARGEAGPYAGYSAHTTAAVMPPLSLASLPEVFTPTSAREAARTLLSLTQSGHRAVISNRLLPAASGRIRIETSALSGIKHYAPDDLYIIVGAGTTYAEVQDFLALDGKQLAFLSPWPEATIGGLIATNINSPQRMRYGAIRDLVLSTTVALADGRVIRTGRPIVKNVAGYDLTKAFIGSYGSLGLITDVTLKIMVQPRVKQTLLIPVDDLRNGLRWGRELLLLALVSSAIVLYNNEQTGADALLHTPYILSYTAEGLADDVRVELDQVLLALHDAHAPAPLAVLEPTGSQAWAALLAQPTEHDLLLRIGLPIQELLMYLQDYAALLQQVPFLADMANGLLYLCKSLVGDEHENNAWLTTLREAALRLDGYALVLNQPENAAIVGYQPQSLSVMRALKQRWDPGHVLDAGIFSV